MEGVQAAMTTRNLEPDQWRKREEWRLVSGRRRQLLKKPNREINYDYSIKFSGNFQIPQTYNKRFFLKSF